LRFISPALKHFVFPLLSRSGYLRRSAGAGPAVVTYHGVFPNGYKARNPSLDGNLVRAESLRRQLELLQKRYHVISPSDFLHWSEGKLSLPPRTILLTCDDALRNTLTEMVPILQEFGLSCLFFATGASADEKPSMLWYEELYLMLLDASQPTVINLPHADVSNDTSPIASSGTHARWWNLVERLSPFNRELRGRLLAEIREQLKLPDNWRDRYLQDSILAARFLVLDPAGIQQLAAAGMSIGAHSLSHPILSHASKELAWREISESRTILEKALGQQIWAFAYPFGDNSTVSAREQRLAEEAGFRCAFMNMEGDLGAKMNRFALPRVHVAADMGLGEFEAHISGFYFSLRRMLASSDDGLELVKAK
jgi:peptidoglycan/xylan/chitin deacetylase (PgdA/CDA1 family)